MSDELADPVQPEGQGGEAPDSPYADYLNRVPEEVRGEVEPVFRDWDANTTRKFQEAAEYRKAWEPFEQLGVNQRDPEEVKWAMQMLEAAKTDPAGVWTWAQEYAQQHGLTQAEQQQLEQDLVDPSIQQMLQQELSAHLGPIARELEELRGWKSTTEQQAAQAEQQSIIRSELDSLKEKHPGVYNEALVEKFIANHMGEADARVAVQKAFADAQAIRAEIERSYAQGKVDTSSVPPESGGGTDSSPSPIRTLEEASRIARARMRAEREA